MNLFSNGLGVKEPSLNAYLLIIRLIWKNPLLEK